MPATLFNEIEIAVSAEKLFNYVTQPWLWHEWHPSSKSARASQSFLATGDHFEEVIEVCPLAPLPPRLLRKVQYSVTEAVPFHSWQVEGKMNGGWLRIRYDFEELDEPAGTTLFQRSLTFGSSGPTRLMQPFLKQKMKRISEQAMNNLKARVEFM